MHCGSPSQEWEGCSLRFKSLKITISPTIRLIIGLIIGLIGTMSLIIEQ